MPSLYEKIILLGDSITEFSEGQALGFGFAPALRDAYIRRMEVVNYGFSGYNTDMILRCLDTIVPTPSESKIRMLIVFLGANDSCFPLDNDRNQCVPLPIFEKNLIKLAQHHTVSAHQPNIMFITPPPIDEHKQREIDFTKGYPIRRSAENTKKYADMVRKVGSELGVPVCDIWTAFMKRAGWRPGDKLAGSIDLPPNAVFDELMWDGLHLSAAGYRVLYDELIQVINKFWPQLAPQNLPLVLPPWDEFYHQYPPFPKLTMNGIVNGSANGIRSGDANGSC